MKNKKYDNYTRDGLVALAEKQGNELVFKKYDLIGIWNKFF